jgi:hypothetical protein
MAVAGRRQVVAGRRKPVATGRTGVAGRRIPGAGRNCPSQAGIEPFHTFAFASAKNFIKKNHPGCGGVPAQPARAGEQKIKGPDFTKP